MNWQIISSASDIEKVFQQSTETPVLLFKHSTRCGTSSLAKSRLDKINNLPIPTYYVDVIAMRAFSNEIAKRSGVTHESPQVLLLYKNEVVYDASHLDIRPEVIQEQIALVYK